MNFPKNLKFKETKIEEILSEIDYYYSLENVNYRQIIKHLEKLKKIPDYLTIISKQDLELLEIIQLECNIHLNKYIEAFDDLGNFCIIDSLVSL